jgi:hypothetical protein
MTIKEALEMLRMVIPARERTVGIEFQVMDYDHYELDDPKRCRVTFRVWDGREGYTGASLEIATQKALLANTPDQGTLEESEPLMLEAENLTLDTVQL